VSIDHDAAVPPYRQLAAILRGQIAAGELAPGAPVPSVKRLRQEYGVAETTARKAVALLRDEGLVETVMGPAARQRRGDSRRTRTDFQPIQSRSVIPQPTIAPG